MEMSLEKGYAATPITNGEVQWDFMSTDDINLMRPYKYKVNYKETIVANNQKTGYANSNNWSTENSRSKNLKMMEKTSSAPVEMSNNLTNFLTSAFSGAEDLSEPIEFKVESPVIFEAPRIEGYELDQLFNTYVYDITESNEPVHHTIRYKPEAKGTIVVKHIWNFNGIEVTISPDEVYNNIFQRNVEALNSEKWSRITENSVYNLKIEENDEIQVFVFEYKPIADWIITNNFHGKQIKSMLLNDDHEPIISPENPFYISDFNNFAWMDGNKINISGAPVIKSTYIIYSTQGIIEHSMCSIAVRYKNGAFGHFFAPSDLVFINDYQQIYPHIELSKVKKVCGFVFVNENPIEALIL